MKSPAKTTARRPKFDLTPISVDEALSNPALASIESTLRSLAGLGEDRGGKVESAVIVPPETKLDQDESDPTKANQAQTPICESSMGDTPIGAPLPSTLQPDTIVRRVIGTETAVGDPPSGMQGPAPYPDAAVEPSTVESLSSDGPIGDTHIGYTPKSDPHIGYTPIGVSNSTPLKSIELENPSISPIGISYTGEKHIGDSLGDDSHIGEQVSGLHYPPESGLPERPSTLTSSIIHLAACPWTVLSTDRKSGQRMMSKMVTRTASNCFIKPCGGWEDKRLPRLSLSRSGMAECTTSQNSTDRTAKRTFSPSSRNWR